MNLFGYSILIEQELLVETLVKLCWRVFNKGKDDASANCCNAEIP